MTKGIKKPKMKIPPVRKKNENWTRSNKKRADLFVVQYLFKTFQLLPRLTNKEYTLQIKKKKDKIKFIIMNELI